MSDKEEVFTFKCHDSHLVGVLHHVKDASDYAVLIVVGGPQYRVGSHRQFVLLARTLAKNGIQTMRFDYRGMGDSEGERRTFEDIDDDIRAAVDTLFSKVPNLKGVVIWGLCDAASAILMYAANDNRINGLILLNPWVHSESTSAKAYMKHYYLSHFFSLDLWKKILTGNFRFFESIRSFLSMFYSMFFGGKVNENKGNVSPESGSFHNIMANGWKNFTGRIMIILSGNDLTASEFMDLTRGSSRWKRLMKNENVMVHNLPLSDHTFTHREWSDQVEKWTVEWVKSI